MNKKIVLSMVFTVTLLFSSFSISAFAEGNSGNGQMNMNQEDDGNYGEGPMNINEDDGPLRVNDENKDNNRANVNATGAEKENNWEWLGLLGLAGLLGLRKRNNEAVR
ncbi:WGxxGxxG family protein [Pseudalkalibacillus sp. R45]|uniref:WGxxGxxG family protein n=1 Tax=Pseudalkalibacillus sp. R45 TaxID=3457433 RepID=UPI003FCDCEDF